jgi:uncharacterized repeat protein (TIGR01451 family)
MFSKCPSMHPECFGGLWIHLHSRDHRLPIPVSRAGKPYRQRRERARRCHLVLTQQTLHSAAGCLGSHGHFVDFVQLANNLVRRTKVKQFSKLMLIAVGFGILAVAANSQLAVAQVVALDIQHDTSPALQTLAGAPSPVSCTEQAPQLFPNPTGITIDRNFCGYFAPQDPLCIPDGKCAEASDASGAAGPDNYFQTENYAATIFDKIGNVVLGPFPTSTFWNNFNSPGNACSEGISDMVVLYDHDAQRWFVSRFAAIQHGTGTTSTTSWYQCFAISTTTNPTGQYYRYVFLIDPTDWNDYPKFGIWPDGYYMTANNRFNSSSPTPPIAHFIAAFERSKMLAGQAAQEIIFKIYNNGLRGGILPADWDGKTPPPAGSPNYLARPLDPNMGWPLSALEVWTVQVDWAGGTGVLNRQFLTPDPFNSALCIGNLPNPQNCIPQPGTAQTLDPLAFGQPMYRLAYRNFGDHEALTFNQTVDAGDFPNHAGIRWYELRKSGSNPWSIYQQNTFAPDATHRWIGSLAMDDAGNIAMGYSASSSSVYPGIRIAGRLASDPPGAMTEAAILEPGLGSETGTVLWADYSHTSVDPLDDCTLWYTGTYQPLTTTGQRSWATKIGSFRFPSCVADLSVTKSRSPSGAIEAGTNVTYTITVKNNGPNDAGNVALSDSVPVGVSFVSLSAPSGWICTSPAIGSAGAITCTKTSVENGESATFTVVATVNCNVPNGTVISNTASAAASTPPDSNPGNNSQTASLTVNNPVPVVSASLALSMLPQNNHDLVNVGLGATATDGACPAPSNFVVQVFGNEDDETPTAPDTIFSPDAKDIAVSTLRLREERVDTGNGRVYLVVVKATDTAGGTGFATLTVVVPLSSSAAYILSVNTQAAAAKAYSDGHQGASPPGFFVIGDGPIIGSKQ